MKEKLMLKLALAKELEDITDSMLCFSLSTDHDKTDGRIENLDKNLSERQAVIEKINILDKEIDNKLNNLDNEESELENKIREIFKRIANKDKELNNTVLKSILEIKAKYYDTKEKLEIGRFEMKEEDKKDRGYFLNIKG